MARKAQAPAPESQSDKFRRLANSRMPKAIKSMRLVKNLSMGQYTYSPAQADKVVATLQAEVDSIKASFQSNSAVEFDL